MTNRDFIDEDLVKPREEVRRIKMGPGDEPARPGGAAAAPDGLPRGVSDLDLPLMARHKQSVDTQTARTVEELERLRQRQEQLEREKRDLEDARRRQAEYDKGKHELLDHLAQSLVTIERQELKTQQLADLLASTRKRFREMLDELKSLREEEWNEQTVREEIGKALVVVNDSRMEYNKSVARIESALNAREGATAEPGAGAVIFEDAGGHHEPERGFGHWLWIGFAVSLPLLLTLGLLAVLFLVYAMGML